MNIIIAVCPAWWKVLSMFVWCDCLQNRNLAIERVTGFTRDSEAYTQYSDNVYTMCAVLSDELFYILLISCVIHLKLL